MKAEAIKKIAVIGAGNMGHQIALACALAGFGTSCCDASREQLQKAEGFMKSYLPGRVAKGKLKEEEAQAAAEVTFTKAGGGAGSGFRHRAVTENLELKREIFARLDGIAPPMPSWLPTAPFCKLSLAAHRQLWYATCTSLTRPW